MKFCARLNAILSRYQLCEKHCHLVGGGGGVHQATCVQRMQRNKAVLCTISSKINGTPKGVYLFISKLHSILTVANLLPHNNISQICYCGKISLQSDAVNCSFSDNLAPLGYHLFCWRWYHHSKYI